MRRLMACAAFCWADDAGGRTGAKTTCRFVWGGLRGGSWNSNENNLRSSNRNNNNPDNENNNIGFRVASPWKANGGFGFESVPSEPGPESGE